MNLSLSCLVTLIYNFTKMDDLVKHIKTKESLKKVSWLVFPKDKGSCRNIRGDFEEEKKTHTQNNNIREKMGH